MGGAYSRPILCAYPRARKGSDMNKNTIGVLLIVLGLLALAYHGFTYTKRDKTVDWGPIQISVDKEKTVVIPPIVGGLAVVAGVVIVVTSKNG